MSADLQFKTDFLKLIRFQTISLKTCSQIWIKNQIGYQFENQFGSVFSEPVFAVQRIQIHAKLYDCSMKRRSIQFLRENQHLPYEYLCVLTMKKIICSLVIKNEIKKLLTKWRQRHLETFKIQGPNPLGALTKSIVPSNINH